MIPPLFCVRGRRKKFCSSGATSLHARPREILYQVKFAWGVGGGGGGGGVTFFGDRYIPSRNGKRKQVHCLCRAMDFQRRLMVQLSGWWVYQVWFHTFMG